MPFGILASLVLLATPVRAPSHLLLPPCEFAESYQFSSAECSIELRNTGETAIAIMSAMPLSEGDSIKPSALIVPAHGVAYAQAHIALRNEVGRTKRLFRLMTDEPGQSTRNAEANGFVVTVLDDSHPKLDFGVVNAPGEMAAKSITLSSREIDDFRIENILSVPAYISAQVAEDGKTLRASVRTDAPWGLHEADWIKLKVNTPQQSEVWVAVRVDVHGEIIPDSNPFALGLMRKGNSNEFLIRLSSRSGKDFQVGAVDIERVNGTAVVESCKPAVVGCKLVRFRISENQPTGAVGGVLRIDLPALKLKLPIFVWGMLVDAQTTVKNFDEEMKRVADAKAASGVGSESRGIAESTGTKVDLKQALKNGVDTSTEQPPPGTGPLLKWSVAHESLVHGYAIYRAESATGPFVRVNKQTILTKSEGEGGASYQWRDAIAGSGKTYWYYVGLLNKDGSKKELSGPQKVVAK